MEEKQKQEKSKEEQAQDRYDDFKTDAAVDDIVAKESDELLKADDEKLARTFQADKPGFLKKVGRGFSRWWRSRWARNLTFLLIVLVAAALMVVPGTRYYLLNAFGVRAGASLRVVDEGTQLPLRNVEVSLQDQAAVTDKEGFVSFDELRLGDSRLQIERRAFAVIDRNVTLGWGSNPLGKFSLKPTGSQYIFQITDFLSERPIEGVEAVGGNSDALSDKDGRLVLTVDDPRVEEIEVVISADGYRQEILSIDADLTEDIEVKMVVSRPHVFVSNRSGHLDVYKVDVDGQNEEVILEATGSESSDMTVLSHPTKNLAAVVSTRSNIRNSEGSLVQTLNLVDINEGLTEAILTADEVRLLDWAGDRLVYIRVTLETGEDGFEYRHTLHSYDYDTGDTVALSSAGLINSALVIDDLVYYAMRSSGNEEAGFYAVKSDGSQKRNLYKGVVWSLHRTSFDRLVYLTDRNDWREYDLENRETRSLDGEPSNLSNHVYIRSPDGSRVLWSERRDGRGVLLQLSPDTSDEKVLSREGGLGYPIRWLTGSVVVYRISTGSEVADYAMSLVDGEPVKIRDVTSVGSDRFSF